MREMKATVVCFISQLFSSASFAFSFSAENDSALLTFLPHAANREREKTLKVTYTLNMFCFSIVQEKNTFKSKKKMYWLNVFALLDSLRVLHCPVLDRFFVVNEFE